MKLVLLILAAITSSAAAAPTQNSLEALVRCITKDVDGQSDVELLLNFAPGNPPPIAKGQILKLAVTQEQPGTQKSASIADASMYKKDSEFGWWPDKADTMLISVDPGQDEPVRRSVILLLETADFTNYLQNGKWDQPILITAPATTTVENDEDSTPAFEKSGTCAVYAHAMKPPK